MYCMFATRSGVIGACVLGLVLTVAALPAQASAPTQVLKFNDAAGSSTGFGFDINSDALPPLGGRFAITVQLQNGVAQFGKPSGATVGRAVLDCSILSEPTSQEVDGTCYGIAHVPNGFITFVGWPYAGNGTQHYAITGGVGPYATARGQITSVDQKNGRSLVTVDLYS